MVVDVVAIERMAHRAGLGIGLGDDLEASQLDDPWQGLGDQMETAAGEQSRAEAESLGAVVIAGNGHQRQAQLHDQAMEHLVEQLDGFGRWYGAIEQVTGDQHQIHRRGAEQSR